MKDTQRQSAARLSLLVARLSDLPALARCHARAVFARRLAKPAMGGAKKGALVGIAQQISNLGGTQPPIGEMLLYELTPRFVDKLGERSAFAREFGRLVYPMRGEVTNPPSRHGSGGSFSTVANSHPLLKRIRTTPLTND